MDTSTEKFDRFKETKIGDLPTEWKVLPIGDIAKTASGGTPGRKRSGFGSEGRGFESYRGYYTVSRGCPEGSPLVLSAKDIMWDPLFRRSDALSPRLRRLLQNLTPCYPQERKGSHE
jgi:hypothetical protein